MLYAIKADSEIVYVGRIENNTEEDWQREYERHKEKIEIYDHDDLEEYEEDFYFQLHCWKEAEHRRITMVHILPELEFEKEEQTKELLIEAIEPIGNIEGWRMPGRENWW